MKKWLTNSQFELSQGTQTNDNAPPSSPCSFGEHAQRQT